jgi:hypothetical protein
LLAALVVCLVGGKAVSRPSVEQAI